MIIRLHLARIARRLRARRAIGFIAATVLLIVALFGNAACFYLFERGIDPSISMEDALWYSIVSITTMGYGDFSASTLGGRIGTVVFIVVIGIASFSLFFGMAIDGLAMFITNARKGLGRVMVSDHILIIHFPSERRVRQIIDEIRSDPLHGQSEIVVVADVVDELPFTDTNVVFVRGSSHNVETYRRARAESCRMAIILSPDYGSGSSDAIVAAAASVVDRVGPEIHIVAECLEESHRPLFDSCNCNAVVLGMAIAGNLLVQEVHDPGIAQLVEVVSSNRRGTTLFVIDVGEDAADYTEIAKGLLDHGVNVMAVNRGTESLTVLVGVESKLGDRLVYSARQRLDWNTLRSRASA